MELETMILRRVAGDERLQRLMTGLPEHRASPYDVLPMRQVLAAVLGGLVRGRFGVIPELLSQGKKASEYGRTLEERKGLLEEA
jgi:hypothetical protein